MKATQNPGSLLYGRIRGFVLRLEIHIINQMQRDMSHGICIYYAYINFI